MERSIAEGKTPTGPEIAAILEANSDGPLPPWFVEIVVKSLRGEIKNGRVDLRKVGYRKFALK